MEQVMKHVVKLDTLCHVMIHVVKLDTLCHVWSAFIQYKCAKASIQLNCTII
jgi:hypothetical protein